MTDLKYKLIRAGKRDPYYPEGAKARYYRLQALRDIPEHNVKAGDLGGFITKDAHLSHYDSCWIGGQAHVIGRVEVTDNAYIGDKATVSCKMKTSKILVSENAKILDNVRVASLTDIAGNDQEIITEIKGNARISGNAKCLSIAEASGDAEISGKVYMEASSRAVDSAKVKENAQIAKSVRISGTSEVSGNVKIRDYSIIENSIVREHATVEKHCIIMSSIVEGTSTVKEMVNILHTVITGNAVVPLGERLKNGIPDTSGIKSTTDMQQEKAVAERPAVSPLAVPNPVISHENFPDTLALFNEIKENIASYETDIVKLIKYPAMVDKAIPETLAMTVALKKANRLGTVPNSRVFREAVETLEEKFIVAESNAIKMTSTILSDPEKKKADKAKDLLAVASNEASSEHEKKMAFVQAFKQLEGVMVVPEIAVDTFRIKIGLKEIEG